MATPEQQHAPLAAATDGSRPQPPRRQRSRAERAAAARLGPDWDGFAAAAIDNQRIDLRLGSGGGRPTAFFNAGQILAGHLPAKVESAGLDAFSAQFCESLTAAAGTFLEAAESVVGTHRTRLYLGYQHASADRAAGAGDPRRTRSDGVVLEWLDGASPAREAIGLDDFRAGRWAGLTRASGDPRYSQAIATMIAQAAVLADLLADLPGPAHARIAIRSFDPEPPGPRQPVPPPAWTRPLSPRPVPPESSARASRRRW